MSLLFRPTAPSPFIAGLRDRLLAFVVVITLVGVSSLLQRRSLRTSGTP